MRGGHFKDGLDRDTGAHLRSSRSARGGYTARGLGVAIFTEAETWEALEEEVRDAVACHYDEGERPSVVRLHFVRDRLLAI